MREGKGGGAGSTARVSSPAFCGAAAVFCGFGVESEREGEWIAMLGLQGC